MDMDFRQPPRSQPPPRPAYHEAPPPPPPQHEQHYDDFHEPNPHHTKGGSSKGKTFLKFLIVLVLIAAAAGGAYYYRDQQAKDQAKSQAAQISDLQSQLANTRDELATAKNSTANAQPTVVKPTKADLDNIAAAVESGNSAALEQLMQDKVTVILAGSEGLGVRTTTQAIKDLDYLKSGTTPWNFALPAATITSYQAGSYKQYFPQSALVGKSKNGYVVSFTFGDDGKINTVFMANSDKSLV